MKFSWSDQGNLRQLTFDATPGDTHLVSATVTEHPVEQGVAITDNVRPMPLKLTVEVVISNTPIDLPSGADDDFTDGVVRQQQNVALSLPARDAITQVAQGPNNPATVQTQPRRGSAVLWTWSAEFDRVRKVYEALTDVVQSGIPVTIETSLVLYDNMILVSMSTPRSVEMGTSAIKFSIDCQQIRTVESQTVAAPAPKAKIKTVGHKPTKEESDPKKASVLHGLVQSAKTAPGLH